MKYLILTALLLAGCKKEQALTKQTVNFVKIVNGSAILQTTYSDGFVLVTDFQSKDGEVMATCDPDFKYICYCDSGEVAIYEHGKIIKQGKSVSYP